jgi:hypothetical protein
MKFNLLARRASRLAAALILISATPTLSEAQFAAAGQPGSTSGACASPPSQVGGVGGVQWAAAVSGAACSGAQPSAGLGNGTPPSPPYVGVPPLAFHGGPVAGKTTPGELTVTPVYWVPSGGTHTIPAGYRRLINKFIADSATDSGKPTDVFSSVTQYTTSEGAHLKYKLHAGTPLTDTNAFPDSGCTPDAGLIWSDGTTYSTCITNAQLLNEARNYTRAHGLPNRDLAHLYMFFLPKGVETCFTSTNGAGGGLCSINRQPGVCGYHAYAAPPLVADMNYAVVDSPLGWTCSSDAGTNTGGNQSPNANIDADTEISLASHEIAETITDPTGSAWYDSLVNENGDDCSYIYGDSISFQGTAGALYNQTVNGHRYFIQGEFSNQDFNANSVYSCIQREDSVTVRPRSGSATTALTVAGGGFASGETVIVTYETRLVTPKTVTVCTTTATSIGTFSCTGNIAPKATAGGSGEHEITAMGSSSLRQPTATFTLTGRHGRDV